MKSKPSVPIGQAEAGRRGGFGPVIVQDNQVTYFGGGWNFRVSIGGIDIHPITISLTAGHGQGRKRGGV